MLQEDAMEKADILISNCMVLPMTGKEAMNDGALAIRDGKIAFVGRSAEVSGFVADKEINARGKVALPGLINCHTHVPMTLFRGVADDQPLDRWLKKSIWPLEARLKPDDVYAGALLGCLEMISGGTTCFAGMYFFEEMVARAVRESGLRGVLAEGIMEMGNREIGEKMLSQSEAFARLFNGYADGRVTTMLGPHAAFSCSSELLAKVAEEASELGVGVHIHVAESQKLSRNLAKKRGLNEVELLDEIGFLKASVLAAHCVNLSDGDMRVLSQCGVSVAHVPVSNMKLGSGVAHIAELLKLGVNVGLGTDGPASNNVLDMFETMKLAALLQKGVSNDPTVLPAYEVLRMATIGGAGALGLERRVGSLEVGKKADVILVDLEKPHLKPLHNVFSSLVYSAKASDVDTVIVDGRILMENRAVGSLDEQDVVETARKAACSLTAQ
jgi:5-methylthioadenosine/S-adenosylhomocysteine deaminase